MQCVLANKKWNKCYVHHSTSRAFVFSKKLNVFQSFFNVKVRIRLSLTQIPEQGFTFQNVVHKNRHIFPQFCQQLIGRCFSPFAPPLARVTVYFRMVFSAVSVCRNSDSLSNFSNSLIALIGYGIIDRKAVCLCCVLRRECKAVCCSLRSHSSLSNEPRFFALLVRTSSDAFTCTTKQSYFPK